MSTDDLRSLELAGRCTPSFIRDLECWRGADGTLWCYSEPADIWFVREGDERTGNKIHTSARSYFNLLKECGPLTPEGEEAVRVDDVLSGG